MFDLLCEDRLTLRKVSFEISRGKVFDRRNEEKHQMTYEYSKFK